MLATSDMECNWAQFHCHNSGPCRCYQGVFGGSSMLLPQAVWAFANVSTYCMQLCDAPMLLLGTHCRLMLTVQGSGAKGKPSPLMMRPQKAQLAGSPSEQSPRAPWEIKASTVTTSPLAKKYAATPGLYLALHICTSAQWCTDSQIFCRQTHTHTLPLCSSSSGLQDTLRRLSLAPVALLLLHCLSNGFSGANSWRAIQSQIQTAEPFSTTCLSC